MAEILGLTVSDFPFLRMKPANMPWVLWGNLAWGWRDQPQLPATIGRLMPELERRMTEAGARPAGG